MIFAFFLGAIDINANKKIAEYINHMRLKTLWKLDISIIFRQYRISLFIFPFIAGSWICVGSTITRNLCSSSLKLAFFKISQMHLIHSLFPSAQTHSYAWSCSSTNSWRMTFWSSAVPAAPAAPRSSLSSQSASPAFSRARSRARNLTHNSRDKFRATLKTCEIKTERCWSLRVANRDATSRSP